MNGAAMYCGKYPSTYIIIKTVKMKKMNKNPFSTFVLVSRSKRNQFWLPAYVPKMKIKIKKRLKYHIN